MIDEGWREGETDREREGGKETDRQREREGERQREGTWCVDRHISLTWKVILEE